MFSLLIFWARPTFRYEFITKLLRQCLESVKLPKWEEGDTALVENQNKISWTFQCLASEKFREIINHGREKGQSDEIFKRQNQPAYGWKAKIAKRALWIQKSKFVFPNFFVKTSKQRIFCQWFRKFQNNINLVLNLALLFLSNTSLLKNFVNLNTKILQNNSIWRKNFFHINFEPLYFDWNW